MLASVTELELEPEAAPRVQNHRELKMSICQEEQEHLEQLSNGQNIYIVVCNHVFNSF